MKRILSLLLASVFSLSLFAVMPVNAVQSVIKDMGDRAVAIDEYEVDIEEFMRHPVCPEGMEMLGLTIRFNMPGSEGSPVYKATMSEGSPVYKATMNIDLNDETCATIANMDLSIDEIYGSLSGDSLKGFLTLLQVALDIKMERYEWDESGKIYRVDMQFAIPAYTRTEDTAPASGKTYYEKYYSSWNNRTYYDEVDPEYLDFSEYSYYETILLVPNFSKDIDPSKDYYFIDLLSQGGDLGASKIKNPSDKIALFLGLETQEEEILKKSYVGSFDLNKFPLRPFEGKTLADEGMSGIEIYPENLSQVAIINGKTYLFFTYRDDHLFLGINGGSNSLTVAYSIDGELVEVPTNEGEITYAVLPFLENGFLAGMVSANEIFEDAGGDGYYHYDYKSTMSLLDSDLNLVHEWDNVSLISEVSGTSKKGGYGLYGAFSSVNDFSGGNESSSLKIHILKISLLDNETAPETFDGLAGHVFSAATGLLGLGLILTINRRTHRI